ncbi:MAG: hypothetical protein K9L86_06760 [Candidatus Omnitrophica bacterium]|nr:hypothetical protein [Candidatus Omnitrophota bacterium]
MSMKSLRVIFITIVVFVFSLEYAQARNRQGGGSSSGSGYTPRTRTKVSSQSSQKNSNKDKSKSVNKEEGSESLKWGKSDDSIKVKSNPQQKENILKLKEDAKAIKDKSNITQDQKDKIKSDFSAIMDGAQKPSEESVNNLVGDLTRAAEDGKLGPKEAMKISESVSGVLESANISEEEVWALKKDVEAVAEASNLNQQDTDLIIADVEAIIDTARANSK